MSPGTEKVIQIKNETIINSMQKKTWYKKGYVIQKVTTLLHT